MAQYLVSANQYLLETPLELLKAMVDVKPAPLTVYVPKRIESKNEKPKSPKTALVNQDALGKPQIPNMELGNQNKLRHQQAFTKTISNEPILSELESKLLSGLIMHARSLLASGKQHFQNNFGFLMGSFHRLLCHHPYVMEFPYFHFLSRPQQFIQHFSLMYPTSSEKELIEAIEGKLSMDLYATVALHLSQIVILSVFG